MRILHPRITLLTMLQIYLLAGKKTGHFGAAMGASSLHHLAAVPGFFYCSALNLDLCTTLYTISFEIHWTAPFPNGVFFHSSYFLEGEKVRIYFRTFFNIEDNAQIYKCFCLFWSLCKMFFSSKGRIHTFWKKGSGYLLNTAVGNYNQLLRLQTKDSVRRAGRSPDLIILPEILVDQAFDGLSMG